MKNMLKWYENVMIFPLKFSQDFNGFWFHSETPMTYQNISILLRKCDLLCNHHVFAAKLTWYFIDVYIIRANLDSEKMEQDTYLTQYRLRKQD